jgi:hypothetical protein
LKTLLAHREDVRDRQIAREQPFDTRAILLANAIVPVGTYLVAADWIPIAGLLLPIVLTPVIAAAIMRRGSPVFVGAAASCLAAILTVLTGVGWAWVLWSDLGGTYLAEFTYLSFYFAFPALVGGVIGCAAIGGILGKVTVGIKAVLGGEAQVEFRF